jgi:type III restriction enzyme
MPGGPFALVETKGRQDQDVPRKAGAAVDWCKTASKSGTSWQYVFIPQAIMEGLTGNRFGDLVRACAPALQNLLSETTKAPELPLFGEEAKEKAEAFYTSATLDKLTARERKAAEDAAELYRYFEKKTDAPSFAPVFNVLLGPLDQAATAVILGQLQNKVPSSRQDQDNFFSPYIRGMDRRSERSYQELAAKLKRALIYGNPHSVIGLLRSCLDLALNDNSKLEGVFAAVREGFKIPGARNLLDRISAVNEFRNTYVAHHEKDLTDQKLAQTMLLYWVDTLALL